MYRSLYTGSTPMQMPTHACAEWKGCLRGSFPGSTRVPPRGSLLDGLPGKWWTSAYATKIWIPCARAYASLRGLQISGQQPTQLHKEFPRIHNFGHSKKRCSYDNFWVYDDGKRSARNCNSSGHCRRTRTYTDRRFTYTDRLYKYDSHNYKSGINTIIYVVDIN